MDLTSFLSHRPFLIIFEILYFFLLLLFAAVSDPISNAIIPLLNDQQTGLSRTIPDAILLTVVPAVTKIASLTISISAKRLVPPLVLKFLSSALTNTLTRALAHSLTPTLFYSLKYNPLREPYCFYCLHHHVDFCGMCFHSPADSYAALYYLDFFTCFYSDEVLKKLKQ